MPGKMIQLREQIGRAQIDPPDDTANEIVPIGQFQHPARLVDVLPDLHGHAPFKPKSLKQRSQVLGHEVAPEGGQLVGHPPMFGGIVLPEMLMRVDSSRGSGGVYRGCHPSQL
jgi:hypothetical protein